MCSSSSSSTVVIVESEHFYVAIQEGLLCVISVPLEFIPQCGWWLNREIEKLGYNEVCGNGIDDLFTSFIFDNDGLSLVTRSINIPIIKSLLKPECFTLSPQLWKALVINVTGSAGEFPGAVYYLADILSTQGFSIFHISTYESEIFLVQEKDIDQVSNVLKESIKPEKVNEFLERSIRKSSDANKMTFDLNDLRQAAAEASYAYEETNSGNEHDDNVNLDMSWISPVSNPIVRLKQPLATYRENFFLNVLPNQVILAKLNGPASNSNVLKIVVNLMMYDARFCDLERICEQIEKRDNAELSLEEGYKAPTGLFMWGMWRFGSEMTFLLEEEDLHRFPQGSLEVYPQRWRVVKLAGRPIAFDETGIVSSMSRIETSVPSLNISTATTNCTLVPEEVLLSTVDTLSRLLQCPVRGL